MKEDDNKTSADRMRAHVLLQDNGYLMKQLGTVHRGQEVNTIHTLFLFVTILHHV